ncbi:MAG: GNAT family N-acetyltransferase [Robiginitomaculum sp.]|nr:MAG: GNAT family N-acetyltransferase [Robiginitomaculum sp.]
MSVTIRPLTPEDQAEWVSLWHGYLVYYKSEVPDEVTRTTWDRLIDPEFPIDGFCACDAAGQMLGFVHYMFHPVTWAIGPRCYLEDLFTSEDARGKGVGRALIEAVAQEAKLEGADQLYWLTEDYNTRAHALYDKLATKTHFIKYMKTL